MLDCRLQDAANSLTVVGMNHGEHSFQTGNGILGIESEDAEKLARPDSLTGAEVVFRTAGAGDLLGVHQQGFLLAQSFFGETALGDIACEQADGMRFACTASDGRNPGLKPAAARGEVNGEFDVFGDAVIDDSAEEPGEGMEDFIA